MDYYNRIYVDILKKNFLLVIIILVLLFPTFFVWAGIPIFWVGAGLDHITANRIFTLLGISLSGGVIFSLYFLPINVKVARHIANARKGSLFVSFLWLEAWWVFIGAIIWGMVLGFVFYQSGAFM